MRFIDLTGKKFGNLTVIKETSTRKNKKIFWLCKCDCGNFNEVSGSDLKSGNTKSCGCNSSRKYIGERAKTHGLRKTRFYRIWTGMKTRCYNKNVKTYVDYGLKGIIVCERWHKFENFYEDMYDTYNDTLTLERINVNDNYCKENCKWIPKNEQSLNKTNSFIVDYKCKKTSLTKLCYDNGIKNYKQIKRRIIEYGWDVEKALNTPIKQLKQKEPK